MKKVFITGIGKFSAIIGYNLGANYGVGLYFNYYLNNSVYKFRNENYKISLTGL